MEITTPSISPKRRAAASKLSDRGHTLMHVSYEHDVDSFYEGARASLREQIVRGERN